MKGWFANIIVVVVIIVKRAQTDLYYIQNQNSVNSLRRARATKKKKQFARCCVLPYSYFNLEGHVRVCVFSAARFVFPRIFIPV